MMWQPRIYALAALQLPLWGNITDKLPMAKLFIK
jgi:hypothetical protein